jgi:hypothetical protein
MHLKAAARAHGLPLGGQAYARRNAMNKPRDPAAGNGEASARSLQENFSRPEPKDLDEGFGVGRGDRNLDAADADPGKGEDASGRPSTARSGSNTTT